MHKRKKKKTAQPLQASTELAQKPMPQHPSRKPPPHPSRKLTPPHPSRKPPPHPSRKPTAAQQAAYAAASFSEADSSAASSLRRCSLLGRRDMQTTYAIYHDLVEYEEAIVRSTMRRRNLPKPHDEEKSRSIPVSYPIYGMHGIIFVIFVNIYVRFKTKTPFIVSFC